MISQPVNTVKYEIQGQTIIFHELADGTYHASGTTHIYTKEQYDAGVSKLLARGGKRVD